jgi:hypothetical protein
MDTNMVSRRDKAVYLALIRQRNWSLDSGAWTVKDVIPVSSELPNSWVDREWKLDSSWFSLPSTV